MHRTRTQVVAVTLVATLAAVVATPASAQAIRTWTGAGGSAWLTTTNWSPSGTFPGNAPNANPTGEGLATDIFSIAPANTASTIGINMNTLAAGSGVVGLILGGMDVNKTDTTNVSIFDSSSTTPGLLQLNGATINSATNTLIRLSGSANLTLAGVSTGTLGLRLGGTNGIFDVTNGRTLAINSNISEPSGTASGFTKTGTNTLTLGGSNSFTGLVTLSAGTLSLNNSFALGTGSLSLGANATQVALASANLDISRPVTVTGGGGGATGAGLIHFTPSTGSGTWSGNITTNGAPTAGGMFGTGGGELVLSGTVRANNGSLTVRTGVVTLTNTGNVFSRISVNDGTLKIGADNAVPVSGSIGLSDNYGFAATLNLNGFNQSAGIIFGSGSTATIKNDGATRKTLTLTGTTPSSGIPYTVITRSGTSATTMTFSDGTGGMDLVFSTGTNVPFIDNTAPVLISSTLTSASGFTKTGTSTLTLSASNGSLLAGTITGSAGTLVARISGALGSGTVALAGSTLQFDTSNGTYANPIVTTVASQINANNVAATLSGPITVSGSTIFRGQGGSNNQFILTNANAITSTNDSSVTFNVDSSQNHSVSGIINLGAGAVTKASTATLTLSNAANAYSGGLYQAGSGGITISAAGAQGSGPITFASGGSGAITFSNVSGTVANNVTTSGGSGGITKTGASTMTLTGTTSYSGSTVIGAGTLAFEGNHNNTGSLVIGSSAGSTTTGNANFAAASGTFGGLTVQTNSATPNVITLGSGRTLATNGNVTIGANTAAGVATGLTVSAGGTWTVTNAASGASFQVGAATGGTNWNAATVDLSGIDTFTSSFSNASSLFRVGDVSTASTTANVSTMTLAPTSTITSATVAVGDTCGASAVQSLLLGSGNQTINANALVVGLNTTAANSIRSSGLLQFAGGSGSLTVRGQDGSSAAALIMNKSTSFTGSVPVAIVDLTGHAADLLLSSIDMTIMSVNQSGAVGAYSSTLSFDKGTLTSGTTNLGARLPGVATSGTFTATANIGSASNLANTASLGAVTLAAHSGSNCTIRGALNVTGTATSVSMGSLSIASNTGGVAGGVSSGTVAISGGSTTVAGGITLASSAGFGTVNGTLNLTDGALTVGGDITQVGTVTGSLGLNGGSLNMGGFAIGSLANPISAASFAAGTLRNLGQYNGGAALQKTGTGLLVLAGSNAFTGGVQVNAGTLTADSLAAFGSGTLAVAGGTLDLGGLAVTNAVAVSQGSVTNASAYAGTQTVSGAISYAGTIGGALNVATGGLLMGNNVTFSGPVSITGTHSPGGSPGLQTFTSGLGYTSAATLVWELSANTAAAIDRGISYDAVDMTTNGALSIDPAATISLVFNAPLADSTPSTVDWDDAFWGSPQQWKAIDVIAPVTWNEVSFANVLVGNDSTGASLGSKRPGATFTTTAQGGDLYVVYVPEPSLLAAGAAGLGVLLVVRRRR